MTIRRRGFSLIELMISMVLLTVELGAVKRVTLSMQRSYVRQQQVTAADDALRAAELTLLTVMRTAGANPYALSGTNAPQLDPDPTNSGVFNSVRAVADFNPANGVTTDNLEDVQVSVVSDTMRVRWVRGGTADPVAFGIRSLLFQYYASNGVATTTKANVAVATRVKITITAIAHTRTDVLTQRVFWLNLRNRQ
jgi:prepilin-type N-terminal cleavage/methylation domain-containing protein